MANYDLDYEGSVVQDILDTGKSLEDDGYIFLGTATPSTIPGTPIERVAYVGGPGTYNNFGTKVVVPSGSIVVITYSSGAWSKTVINASLPVSTTLENNDTTIPTGKAVKTVIDAEATARDAADTALQNAITAINTKLGEGYIYAGIATASTNPGTPTGKVFYLAKDAGTYTNFGGLVVTHGINVLKYNGSDWSQEQLTAIDDVPTAGSNNLVKSMGVEHGLAYGNAYHDNRSVTMVGSPLDNYFINSDNIDTYNENAAINTYSLQNIKVLHVIMRYSGNNNRFLFYDSSDNIISSGFLPQLPAWPAKHDTFIYVPDGAVKFRTGYIKDQGITVEDGSVDNKIDINAANVLPYAEYDSTIFGKIYRGGGRWDDFDNWVFTKVKVYGNNTEVHIKASVASALICFFDVNGNEIGSVPGPGTSDPVFDDDVTVPSGAAYIGFSHKINDNTVFTIRAKSDLQDYLDDTRNQATGSIDLVQTVVGKRVDAKLNGAFVDGASWNTLIYNVSGTMLPIHVKARLGTESSNIASIVFCDGDGNVIDAIHAPQTAEGYNVDIDYITPFGTKVIKATTVTTSGLETIITYGGKSLYTKVNNNEAYGDIEYQSTLLGSYINKDGETIALNNHFAIATYKLYGLPLVHCELKCNQNLFTVFYDKDGNSLMKFHGTTGSAHDDTFDIQAPVGAVTMRVSYLTSGFRHVIRPAYPTNMMLERVSSESIGNITFDSTENGYFLNDYFEKTSNPGYSLDKYMIHQGLNTIHIKARIGTTTYIVFYDANDVAIKGYAGNSGEGVTVDSDFNVPSSASYVLISYSTYAGCEVTVNSLASVGNSRLKGKKIVWLGTSIPATGSVSSYPNKVGAILGASLYNEALGSSLMRVGRISHTTGDPLGDEYGLTGWSWNAFVRALSYTQKEKIYVMERWTTEQRQAKLIEEGYTPQQVASVVGYRELMSNEQDKPATITQGSSTWNDALAWCWDSNGGQNIEGKIQKYLNSENEPDLWVLDHMRNDFANGTKVSETKEQEDTVPSDIEDRHYPIGAMVYLIHKIWAYNPKAKIVIMSHYTQATLPNVYLADKCCDAQKKVSDLLGVPFIPWFDNSGVNDYPVMTVGYWDSNNEWQDSGYSGTDNIVDYNIYPINENDRTLTEADGCFAAGTRVHDLSTRFINMRDGVHPEFEPTRQRWAEKISKLLETYA